VDRHNAAHFLDFYALVRDSHHLPTDMPFTVSYTDPRNGDLLPITNDDNLGHAFSTALPLLRLLIYRKQGASFTSIFSLLHVLSSPYSFLHVLSTISLSSMFSCSLLHVLSSMFSLLYLSFIHIVSACVNVCCVLVSRDCVSVG